METLTALLPWCAHLEAGNFLLEKQLPPAYFFKWKSQASGICVGTAQDWQACPLCLAPNPAHASS